MLRFVIFLFKQKTAYEMRISDWSSDVCSSDLHRQEGLVARNQLDGHPARAQNFLPVIDVVEEGVQCAHALFDAARQAPPFARRDDPRHDVEGDQPLVGFILAIDVESDARSEERRVGKDWVSTFRSGWSPYH